MLTSISPNILELSKNDIISVPTIINNKILMAPGEWNGVHYTAEEIKKAFNNTNWSDKDIVSVILDHSDKPLSVHDWVGWIKAPRLEGDNLVGDLELYDENVLVKLVRAKAKFGISPRVKGTEENSHFKNFTFENFSIVTNPAVKLAYLNLSESQSKGGKMTEKMTEKELNEEIDETDEIEEDELEETEDLKEKKNLAKKKKYPYPYEDEMSDEELLTITANSEWTDFVARMRKKYPKISFKDIAKAYKEKTKEDSELEALSEEELARKIEQLAKIKKKKYPAEEKKEEKKDEKKEGQVKENTVVKEMSEKIAELEKRLNEPDAKSVQELSQQSHVTSPGYTDGVTAMAEFLKSKFA